MGIINWCDEKITELKEHNIQFINGRPKIPVDKIYNGVPDLIETYQFRNEIPKEKRKKSLICFYSFENRILPRLETVDSDVEIFKEYAGIVGMDISPSINMLRPRQLHSILINQIYNCLIAIRGVMVAINSRIGDLKTNSIIEEYPKNQTLIFGNLGCKGLFKEYSLLQFKDWIIRNKPQNICIYGSFGKRDIRLFERLKMNFTLNLYQGHNYGKVINKKSVLTICGSKYTKTNPDQGFVYEFILTHGIKKSKPFDESSLKGGESHGC